MVPLPQRNGASRLRTCLRKVCSRPASRRHGHSPEVTRRRTVRNDKPVAAAGSGEHDQPLRTHCTSEYGRRTSDRSAAFPA